VRDHAGPVHFYALPYAEPSIVRERLSTDSIAVHEEAVRALVERVRLIHPPGERSILLAHAFVAGGKETESERPLSVGGTDKVDCSCFEGFNYVALGHLHRPQTAGGPQIRYAGSLLKYSFSEVDHKKTVNLVEMDDSGECHVETLSLTPRRDVRRIEGYLKDILNGPESGHSREDYVMVTLLDTGAILDVMGKLREVYPNVLHVERPCLDFGSGAARDRVDHRKLNDADLFADFFSQVAGKDLTDAEAAAYELIVDDLRRREREAAAHEAS
jgi:exonuclease SbcD